MELLSDALEPLQSFRFLGADGVQWAFILFFWFVFSVAFLFVTRFVSSRVERLAKRTSGLIDDIVAALLEKTLTIFVVVVALYLAARLAGAGSRALEIIGAISTLLFAIQAIIWGNTVINLYVQRYREQKLADDAGAVTTVQAAGFVGRIMLYSVVFLLALENLGIDITALVAGLGIGGIAVALAVQNVLGDLFASLSIVLDKPFVVGDFLIIDDYLGSVERVGLKTTRIRSLSGEQLVFSNSDLLNSRIRNYKRMFERRVVFDFRIKYGTPRALVPEVPKWVREAVESHQNARFDRAHFFAFGQHALEYEVVYYVLDPDYNTYMDIQQAINLAIMDKFEEHGVEFALPTQTIHAHFPDQEAPVQA